MNDSSAQMNITVVGHVDHGKSSLIGRILWETGSVPQSRMDYVGNLCRKSSKPFEYAFLLDALKDERDQGITIDTARCFFKTEKRRYVLIDAPGHVEFLKNMITGASRAEAAFLIIDAKEGVRENSKRHGYILSMLGIRQISVVINKMDLVGYSREVFDPLKDECTSFLSHLNVHPISFIPVSALNGVNITAKSPETPWFDGPTIVQQLDSFSASAPKTESTFRFPVQDIYKFTEMGDDRRIFAGTVQTGRASAGDEVVFYPSLKKSRICSIESFNTPRKDSASAGEAAGFTLETQVYVKPGEIMARAAEARPCLVSSRFRANIFWIGRTPMIQGKRYKIKIGTNRMPLRLVSILNIIDASDLTSEANKKEIERHDVAECIFETTKPIAFDRIGEIQETGRFVVVDNYDISGAGIILDSVDDGNSTLKEHVREREFEWKGSGISAPVRAAAYGHGSKFVVITGNDENRINELAAALEKGLFDSRFKSYYMRFSSLLQGLDTDISIEGEARDEHIRRLGELARIMTDSGLIFITAISGADEYDISTLELLNRPNEILVVALDGSSLENYTPNLSLESGEGIENALGKIYGLLRSKNVLVEYYI